MLTVYIALFVTVLDQVVKWIVQQHMVWGESIPLIPGVFHLTYIINPGAAFGILAYQRWFFLAIVILLFGAFFFSGSASRKSPAIFRRDRYAARRGFGKCHRPRAYQRRRGLLRLPHLADLQCSRHFHLCRCGTDRILFWRHEA